jgi:hypothetical protein
MYDVVSRGQSDQSKTGREERWPSDASIKTGGLIISYHFSVPKHPNENLNCPLSLLHSRPPRAPKPCALSFMAALPFKDVHRTHPTRLNHAAALLRAWRTAYYCAEWEKRVIPRGVHAPPHHSSSRHRSRLLQTNCRYAKDKYPSCRFFHEAVAFILNFPSL